MNEVVNFAHCLLQLQSITQAYLTTVWSQKRTPIFLIESKNPATFRNFNKGVRGGVICGLAESHNYAKCEVELQPRS